MGGHQLHQGHQVHRGDSLAATLLLLLALLLGGGGGLSRVVKPQVGQQHAGRSGLHDLHNSVVDRVLVLLEPPSHVVGHDTGVVRDSKVGVLVSLRLGLQEYGELAERGLQLLLKGLVGGLGEERLLLQDGPDAHGLLKHDDGSGQVHSEVDHDPVNALLHVLLLLNNEHVVVEELLQLLVHKVDGDLLKAVVLKDLKSGNVEHSAEVGLLQGGIDEGVVTFVDEPLEDAVKDGPGDTTSGHGGLLAGLTLDDPLGTDLDSWLTEGLEHCLWVASEGSSGFSCKCIHGDISDFSLVVTTLGLVNDSTASHHTGSQHVAVELLLLREPKHIESILSVEQLLVIVNRVDLGLALRHVDVVVDVGADEALGPKTSGADVVSVGLEELVEDVVGPLHFLLLSDTGLLQEVGHDVATSQLTRGGEVDTDELTESGGVVVPGGLGVTIRLQDGVGGHDLVLKRNLLLFLLASSASGHHGQIGDHLLGVLGLAGTRPSGDQHGVVLGVLEHVPMGALSNGPQVGGTLVPPLTQVDLADPVGIQGVTLVGVHHHREETRVGVDELGLVASLQVPEDRSVVEVGQVDHVLALLKLGRVDTPDLASLQSELLVRHSNGHLHGKVSTLHS